MKGHHSLYDFSPLIQFFYNEINIADMFFEHQVLNNITEKHKAKTLKYVHIDIPPTNLFLFVFFSYEQYVYII